MDRNNFYNNLKKYNSSYVVSTNNRITNREHFYESVDNYNILSHTSPLQGSTWDNVKYYKREGEPGHYRYYWTKEEWDAHVLEEQNKNKPKTREQAEIEARNRTVAENRRQAEIQKQSKSLTPDQQRYATNQTSKEYKQELAYNTGQKVNANRQQSSNEKPKQYSDEYAEAMGLKKAEPQKTASSNQKPTQASKEYNEELNYNQKKNNIPSNTNTNKVNGREAAEKAAQQKQYEEKKRQQQQETYYKNQAAANAEADRWKKSVNSTSGREAAEKEATKRQQDEIKKIKETQTKTNYDSYSDDEKKEINSLYKEISDKTNKMSNEDSANRKAQNERIQTKKDEALNSKNNYDGDFVKDFEEMCKKTGSKKFKIYSNGDIVYDDPKQTEMIQRYKEQADDSFNEYKKWMDRYENEEASFKDKKGFLESALYAYQNSVKYENESAQLTRDLQERTYNEFNDIVRQMNNSKSNNESSWWDDVKKKAKSWFS